MPSVNRSEFSAHYCKGTQPVAFVFSVPGRKEQLIGKPVVGATGKNLEDALKELHRSAPELFKSRDRYAYRITNAFKDPTYKAKDGMTERSKKEILAEDNVERVVNELRGCEMVVLCGRKARLLKEELEKSAGLRVLSMWHTSSQALLSKYNEPELRNLATSTMRSEKRAELWARELLRGL